MRWSAALSIALSPVVVAWHLGAPTFWSVGWPLCLLHLFPPGVVGSWSLWLVLWAPTAGFGLYALDFVVVLDGRSGLPASPLSLRLSGSSTSALPADRGGTALFAKYLSQTHVQGDLTSPLSAFTLEVCATFTRQQGLDWRSLAHLRQQAPTVQESSGTAFSTPSAPPIVMASTQPASSDVVPPLAVVERLVTSGVFAQCCLSSRQTLALFRFDVTRKKTREVWCLHPHTHHRAASNSQNLMRCFLAKARRTEHQSKLGGKGFRDSSARLAQACHQQA